MNLRAASDMGSNLDQWRRLLGIPVEALAEQAGVSRTTFSKLLNGNPNVSLATILSVCRSLGILETVVDATDPYDSELARARADQHIPLRVRTRKNPSGP